MASIVWTLSYALPSNPSSWTGPSLFSALGLGTPGKKNKFSRLRRKLVSQGISTFSFRRPGERVDAAYLFPWGTLIRVFRNGVCIFYGTITQTPSYGSGRAEDRDYVASDPWWNLENLTFQQQWVPPSYPGANTTNDPYRSHAFLNQWKWNALANNYSRTPTDQQIAQVIAYATAAPSSAPIQLPSTPGLIPSMDIPLEEVRDITCAEVIRKQLRWMPDAVSWFDYSTLPPTLWIQRRANLAAASLAFPVPGTRSPITDIEVNPRYDLYRAAVKISFEQENQIVVGGQTQSWFLNTPTVYPPSATGRETTALVATVEMEGFNDKVLTAPINVGAISSPTPGVGAAGADLTTDGWWLAKDETLAGYSHAYLQSLSFSTSNGPGLPLDPTETEYSHELLSGQIAPWSGYVAQTCTVTAVIYYTVNNPAAGDPSGGPYTGSVSQQGQKTISVKVQMTNAPLGQQTLTALANATAAETLPLTLAQTLYESVGFIPFEGSVTLVERECSGLVGLGNTFNITGSQQTDWDGMNAVVQQIDEDLDTGTTTVKFGPPSHLGAPDLVELLRLNRFRIVYTNPATQIQSAQTPGQPALGQQTAIENTNAGPPTFQTLGIAAQWSGASPSLGGNAGAIAANGALSSTLPPPPSHSPAITPDPDQGFGLLRGGSLILMAPGNTAPTAGNAAVPSGQNDVNGAPFGAVFRLSDCTDGAGNFYSFAVRKYAVCDPATGLQKSALFFASQMF